MSKMSREVMNQRSGEKMGRVTNFMGGNSFELNPLDTLKIVTSSSIFGEPAYYRDGAFDEKKVNDGLFKIDRMFADDCLRELDKYKGIKTSELMEKVIDDALSYDYEGTLNWAKVLRLEFNMRLNPQVIMVRAATHPFRQSFTDAYPGLFGIINSQVMSRGDDVILQLTYYLFKNGGKKSIPGILKRSWAKKIESMDRYEVHKYRNHGIGLVDTVRICHAHNDLITELMKTGTVKVDDKQKTWETLRASGMSWEEILEQIKLPHMALLRNLRGIFSEVESEVLCVKLMSQLAEGVPYGKQFPFRYMAALNAVKDVNHADVLSAGLNICLDISCENLPMLVGRSAFLSDNSGSAWGTCTSEYGSVTIADIGNLSSMIGANNSEDGHVFAFGDTLKEYAVKKQTGILNQAKNMSEDARRVVGQGTECGIWTFFRNAIDSNEHWDNIVIYSDQQAGHGGLYGMDRDIKAKGFCCSHDYGCMYYIDVPKLIREYREKVNPKVNVYCVQTAGYNNVLVPENGYRTGILYGWTGKELVYIDMMNRFWDDIDRR